VVTKGKNFGKPQTKQVTFNSVRCANLTLLDLLGRKATDLGEYRASHGYMRCPMCRTINRGEQFCNSICKDKYEAEVGTILKVAAELAPAPAVTKLCRSGRKCLRFNRKPAAAKGKSPYCGSNCGASHRARAKRPNFRVGNGKQPSGNPHVYWRFRASLYQIATGCGNTHAVEKRACLRAAHAEKTGS
jgi:hypothetical protein